MDPLRPNEHSSETIRSSVVGLVIFNKVYNLGAGHSEQDCRGRRRHKSSHHAVLRLFTMGGAAVSTTANDGRVTGCLLAMEQFGTRIIVQPGTRTLLDRPTTSFDGTRTPAAVVGSNLQHAPRLAVCQRCAQSSGMRMSARSLQSG